MALPKQYLTPEAFLKIERGNDFKSEYIDGVMYAMAGPSPRHNKITTNASLHLGLALQNSRCTTLNSDQMIWAPWNKYFYADVVAFCDKGEFVDGVLINPTVIFEVLSPSTETFDRGEKLASYRKIDSLVHYVLISQDEPTIEVYTRQDQDGESWTRDVSSGMEARISLSALGVELLLADIYWSYLDFPNTERPR